MRSGIRYRSYFRKPLKDPPNCVLARRLRLNLTLQGLAKLTGIHASAISRFERTGVGISNELLPVLAKALGLTKTWLIHEPERPDQRLASSSTHNPQTDKVPTQGTG